MADENPPAADRYEQHTFAALLTTLPGFNRMASDAQRQLMEALNAHQEEHGGKVKGSITMKLTYELEDGVVSAQPLFKVETPKPKQPKTIFWLSPNMNLTLRNPAQREMFSDVVTAPEAPRFPAGMARTGGA